MLPNLRNRITARACDQSRLKATFCAGVIRASQRGPASSRSLPRHRFGNYCHDSHPLHARSTLCILVLGVTTTLRSNIVLQRPEHGDLRAAEAVHVDGQAIVAPRIALAVRTVICQHTVLAHTRGRANRSARRASRRPRCTRVAAASEQITPSQLGLRVSRRIAEGGSDL